MTILSTRTNSLPEIVECLVVNHLEMQLSYIPDDSSIENLYRCISKFGYDAGSSLPVYKYVRNLARFSDYWSIDFMATVGNEDERLDRKLKSDYTCVTSIIGYHHALSFNPALIFMKSGIMSPTCVIDLAADAIVVAIARTELITK